MIRFRCRCDEAFEVPEELAGTSLQCPTCGLLVDVPTLDDLPGLDAAGYKLHETPLELADESTPRRKTGSGRDTPSITSRNDPNDRRLSLEEFLSIGSTGDDDDDAPLQLKGETSASTPAEPKYDPVTGELIVPIEVRNDPKVVAARAVAIPVGKPVLAYEQQKVGGDRAKGIWWPVLEMWRLPNLIVCLIMTGVHLANMIWFGATSMFFFPIIISLPVLLMTIAHFANIIDETGPTVNDEIPRPLRGGSMFDDFLKPLLQVFTAYFLAWLPIVLINRYAPVTRMWQVDVALSVAFYILVPALLITLITSGALNNLLPNRALSVISAAGRSYWPTVAMGIVGTYAFAFATVLAVNIGVNMGNLILSTLPSVAYVAKPILPIPFWLEVLVTPPAIFVAMYIIHVFCWQMGLIYRRHHERFNWVLQKHVKSNRTDTLAQLHQHRQKQLEAKAAEARRNMEERNVKHSIAMASPAETRAS